MSCQPVPRKAAYKKAWAQALALALLKVVASGQLDSSPAKVKDTYLTFKVVRTIQGVYKTGCLVGVQ